MDLTDLIELIIENNSANKKICKISTIIETLSIEERSIEAFLAHKEIPDKLDNCDISYHVISSNHKTEKYVSLTIAAKYISRLTVHGWDEAWVLGKFQQIEGFINKKFDQYTEEQKLKYDAATVQYEVDENAFLSKQRKLEPDSNISEQVKPQIKTNDISSLSRIFIVHGHDEEMKQAAARTLEKLDLTPIILHEQPDGNKTIMEKIEQYSDVGFAVIILSPDDFAYPKDEDPRKGKYRARQNVIMELGFFLAKLGRKGVFILCRQDDNFEMPSDYSGILYTPYDNAGYWKYKMVDEMKLIDPKTHIPHVLF